LWQVAPSAANAASRPLQSRHWKGAHDGAPRPLRSAPWDGPDARGRGRKASRAHAGSPGAHRPMPSLIATSSTPKRIRDIPGGLQGGNPPWSPDMPSSPSCPSLRSHYIASPCFRPPVSAPYGLESAWTRPSTSAPVAGTGRSWLRGREPAAIGSSMTSTLGDVGPDCIRNPLMAQGANLKAFA
jgi:hypothetical protein